MRTLTKKELAYISSLMARNKVIISDKSADKRSFYRGLNVPMGANERKMRQRIRRKALAMAFDLAKVYAAGILPYGASRDPFMNAKSAEGLVGMASNLVGCLSVVDEEEALALFSYILRLQGAV